MLTETSPEAGLPFFKMLLVFLILRVTLTSIVKTNASYLLECFVEIFAHCIELLICSVSKAKHDKSELIKPLSFLFHIFDPFMEDDSVVTWLTFVMSGHASNDDFLRVFAKSLFVKIFEIHNTS